MDMFTTCIATTGVTHRSWVALGKLCPTAFKIALSSSDPIMR